MIPTEEISAMDTDELKKMTDAEFRIWYEGKMLGYDWNDGNAPCDDCQGIINDPRNMRRFYGRTLDHGCLIKANEEDKARQHRKRDEWKDYYWGRVVSVVTPRESSESPLATV